MPDGHYNVGIANKQTKGESHGKDTDNTGILGARCNMRGSHEESVAGEQDISYICDIPRHFLLGMHMAVLLIGSGFARFKFLIERASQRVQFIAVSTE